MIAFIPYLLLAIFILIVWPRFILGLLAVAIVAAVIITTIAANAAPLINSINTGL